MRRSPKERWRRAIRLIGMLHGVCRALQKYVNQQGLMDSYMVPVARKPALQEEQQPTDNILFDPRHFSADREAKVPKPVVIMLNKESETRTAGDIQILMRLMKDLPSFRKYTLDMQQLMAKIVRYMKCGKRRVVLRKGHVGYSVYFIYSGAVSVVIDKDDQSIFIRPEEIALVENTLRNATVVCSEETEFLVIDKDDYIQNNLYLQQKEEFKQRLKFFRKWKSFRCWPEEALRSLSYVSRTEDYSHNRVILSNSVSNEWLWFVIQGSCDLLKIINPSDVKFRETRDRSGRHHAQGSSDGSCKTDLSEESLKSAKYRTKKRSTESSTPSTSSRLKPAEVLLHDRLETQRLENRQRRVVIMAPDDLSRQFVADVHLTLQMDNDNARRILPKCGSESRKSPHIESSTSDESKVLYVHLATLRYGQCFGMDSLFKARSSFMEDNNYALVSQGCKVVHTPKTAFKEIVEQYNVDTTLLKDDFYSNFLSDEQICNELRGILSWKQFKQSVIGELIQQKQRQMTNKLSANMFANAFL